MEKSVYSIEQFDKLENVLMENIKLVSKDEIKSHTMISEEIIGNIDIEDSSFIATALAVHTEGILIFDEHFKKQKEVQILALKIY